MKLTTRILLALSAVCAVMGGAHAQMDGPLKNPPCQVSNACAFANGATITGAVTVGSGSASTAQSVVLQTAAGQTRAVKYKSAGTDRWWLNTSNASETGKDAGSLFQILG